MPPQVPAPDTPLPTKIARETAAYAAGYHLCLHQDAEILFEDVRQARKRRWWLTTTVGLALIGALGGLAIWIYGVGEQVGSAKTEMGYMQRAEESDRVSIGRTEDAVREMEREQATRYSAIEQALIRLDGRLENIERGLAKRR